MTRSDGTTGGGDGAKDGAVPRRRGRALHRAGSGLRERLSEAAARRGFAEPEVLLRWPEIVGTALAAVCQPVKVTYARTAPGLGATLLVRAPGARATELDHLAPQVIERVNAYYGYRAVSRLKITQATGTAAQPGRAVGGFAEETEPFAGLASAGPAPAGPTPDDAPDPTALAQAARMTEGIRDEGLRRALTSLGARVLSGPARQPPGTPGPSGDRPRDP